ncbi:hypothetical protein GCM10010277_61930 [Streptomyces longisporoflavus]|nr:hypothetical protein GCM10010277_61930 [Streptomyces longisporoflavus]
MVVIIRTQKKAMTPQSQARDLNSRQLCMRSARKPSLCGSEPGSVGGSLRSTRHRALDPYVPACAAKTAPGEAKATRTPATAGPARAAADSATRIAPLAFWTPVARRGTVLATPGWKRAPALVGPVVH